LTFNLEDIAILILYLAIIFMFHVLNIDKNIMFSPASGYSNPKLSYSIITTIVSGFVSNVPRKHCHIMHFINWKIQTHYNKNAVSTPYLFLAHYNIYIYIYIFCTKHRSLHLLLSCLGIILSYVCTLCPPPHFYAGKKTGRPLAIGF